MPHIEVRDGTSQRCIWLSIAARKLATAAAMLLALPVALEAQHFSFEILWQAPPVGEPETIHVFGAGAEHSGGRTVFLATERASDGYRYRLIVDPDRDRSDSLRYFQLKGAPPDLLPRLFGIFGTQKRTPGLTSLVVSTDGEFWVGGSANWHMDMTSSRHSDAYIARIAASGTPRWERVYSNGGYRDIQSMALMRSGDLAVIGRNNRDSMWLARVDSDGRLLWEKRLGSSHGAAVASLADDRIAVVGFEASGVAPGQDYEVHVAAWILDGSGKVLATTRVRDAISVQQYAYLGHVAIAPTEDAVYVVSAWSGVRRARPVEVSKVALDGKLLWSTGLPETMVKMHGRGTARIICSLALAALPNGNAVLACGGLDGHVRLFQFGRSSARYRTALLSLPDCHRVPGQLHLVARDDNTLILSGFTSYDPKYRGKSCAWIGRLTASR